MRQQLNGYFLCFEKVQGAEKTKTTIANLITAINIVPLDVSDCTEALALSLNDFEDALIAVCAQKVNADYIVSRDKGFINAKTNVQVITPNELIKNFI